MEHSSDQKQALNDAETFLLSNETEFALSGAAGTGKTTITKEIISIAEVQGYKVHLTASTNKAVKVCKQFSDTEAYTIHSLLGLKPVDDHQKGRQVLRQEGSPKVEPGSVIILDECSMVSRELFRIIRESVALNDCKIIYVGDSYQIPPVFEKESPVFNEVVKQSKLTTIHRQALESPIICEATRFRLYLDGQPFPELTAHNDVKIVGDETFHQLMNEAFTSQEYTDNPDHCRAVAWTNKRVKSLNNFIRKLTYDDTCYQRGEALAVNSAIVEDNSILFATEEIVKVLSAKNASQCGIEGYKVKIKGKKTKTVFVARDPDQLKGLLGRYAKKAKGFELQLKKAPAKKQGNVDKQRRAAWGDFFTIKNDFADLRPVHASTVHKSQGSTYHTVFIDAGDIGKNTKNHEIARLMYVAYTRASCKVIVTGQLPERLYQGEQ